MPLECFIAMAFDHTDTDRLYEQAIEPLLRRKRVTVFRVDCSNRNEDIDDQILAGLRRCDFVIADLTYARPSVYFEAGVAQGRSAPVIYTCRRDHFKHRPDDHHGNFRVHFDLQMKPIICWSDPSSPAFRRQLEKRIAHVLRPLLRQRHISEKATKELADFARLSVDERLHRLHNILVASVRRHGFSGSRMAIRLRGARLVWLHKRLSTGLTRNELNHVVRTRSLAPSDFARHRPRHVRPPTAAAEHFLFCVLQKVPATRLAEALRTFQISKTAHGHIAASAPSIEPVEDESYETEPISRKRTPRRIPVRRFVHVISGILSESAFRAAIREHLRVVEHQLSPNVRGDQ